MKLNTKHIIAIVVIVVVVVFTATVFSGTVNKSMPTSTKIINIENDQAFTSIIDNAGSKLLVFDLNAAWCGPCHMLQPTLESLATKYADKVAFYSINIDHNPGIAASFQTSGIPYVVFVKNKKIVTSFVGVNPKESYEKIIESCASTQEQCDQVPKLTMVE